MEPARIAHVIDSGLTRGAQHYVLALRDELDGKPDEHRVRMLFSTGPLGRMRQLGLDPRAARQLSAWLRSVNPQVIVAHGGESLKYTALVRPPDVRLVYYKIGNSGVSLRGHGRRAFYRRVVARADVTATVSEELSQEAQRLLGVPPERIVIIPNGRDSSRFAPAQERRRDGPPRATFVGHLTSTKRPERFIEVVRRLRERGVPIDAVMVGDGPLSKVIAPSAADAGVDLFGATDDVPGVLARSDLFVFTSTVQGEGMPGVLIEAGLAGLPAVATDAPGASAVVEHGVTGFVVAVDDLDGLVDAVERVVRDETLRRQMGIAARERCQQLFSLSAGAAQWQELFDRLLGRPPAAERVVEIGPASVIRRRQAASRQLADTLLLAPADPWKEPVSLGGSGPDLWAELDGERPLTELAATIAGRFGIGVDRAEAALVELAGTLVEHGLAEPA